MYKKTKKTLIIAEAGVNHNGDVNLAMKMISAAAEAGADIIKFQTFSAKNLVTSKASLANYQKGSTSARNQFELLKKLELSKEETLVLKRHCEAKGIEFLSTGFDFESLDFLHSIGMRRFKIPSGEITNLPYLRKISAFNLPVIISTGMATLGEVEQAVEVLIANGVDRGDITILHCTTSYPAPLDEINLRSMITLGSAFDLEFGYSDHTEGIHIPIAAVAMGASIIEKHFTLDVAMEGPDQKASLEIADLFQMVNCIRDVDMAMGKSQKTVVPSESENRLIVRKSIVASSAITKGEIFTEQNITAKRPGYGLSPMMWDEVLGKKAKSNFEIDEEIRL